MAEQPHWLWDDASLGIYPVGRSVVAWWQGWHLNAQLDEVQQRRHDPVAAVLRPNGGMWSIHNTYAVADPSFDRNWRQGIGDAAVRANIGIHWLAVGTIWVSPAGHQFVWQGGRWWNRTANRAATAEEAAAANRALAASNAPIQNAGRLTFDPATRSWRSTGGLVYGQGSAQGNRVLHVLEHLTPDPSKPLHTLFNVPRNQIIGLLDEAWAARQGTGVLQANGNRVFDIPMGRVVGTGGETRIRIVVRDGTTNVITAYPIP